MAIIQQRLECKARWLHSKSECLAALNLHFDSVKNIRSMSRLSSRISIWSAGSVVKIKPKMRLERRRRSAGSVKSPTIIFSWSGTPKVRISEKERINSFGLRSIYFSRLFFISARLLGQLVKRRRQVSWWIWLRADVGVGGPKLSVEFVSTIECPEECICSAFEVLALVFAFETLLFLGPTEEMFSSTPLADIALDKKKRSIHSSAKAMASLRMLTFGRVPLECDSEWRHWIIHKGHSNSIATLFIGMSMLCSEG